MSVVIESEVWELSSSLYTLIFVASFLLIVLLPHFSHRTTSSISDANAVSSSSSFIRFQRKFLFLFSLSSALEGLWLVYGEHEWANNGVSKQQMIYLLSAGCFASIVVAPILGMISDAIGHKKFCLLFTILHLIMGVWKTLAAHPTVWIASTCISLASSIFSFSFETWMVVEHDKQGYRHDALNDTFWLMIFFESTSFIASQVLANWALVNGAKKYLISPSVLMTLLAAVNLAFTSRCPESPARGRFKEHRAAFFAYIAGDKRIWLLGCGQACLHFSVAVFWILWAPTIVVNF